MIRTARFGPDYQTIYYGALWDGDECRVYAARPETPESAPLQNLPAAAPLAISSSGELALSLGQHLRSTMPYGTLARVPLTGGAPRPIAEGVKYADFSPDGHDLAVVRLIGGVEQLEYPLGMVIAKPAAPGGGFSFPRVSRDGSRVACFELTSAGALIGTVVVVDRAGNKQLVSPQYFNCFGLAWKGDEVWFTAAGDRPLFRDAIYTVAPGGAPRQIARLPGNASLHDVAPDGRFLMARTDDRGGIAALPPGETSERDLSWLDLPVPVDISRDGRSMLFAEVGVGGGPQSSVYVRSTTGSPAVRLGEGRAMSLSPDGLWALAADPTSFDASPFIDLLPVGAGAARRIQQPGFAYNYARWLPDAKRLIVRAREKGQAPRFYELTVDGGTMRAFTPEGVGPFWAVSPDGHRVAASAASGLEIHSVSGGQPPKQVPGLSGPQVIVAWIDRGLLVYEEPDPSALGKVLLIDPETGARETWREILPRDPSGIMNMGALVVTPDGGSYAYWWFRALSDLYLGSGLS